MSSENHEVDIDEILRSVQEQTQSMYDSKANLSKEEESELQKEVNQIQEDFKDELKKNQESNPKPEGFRKFLLVDDSSTSRKFLKSILSDYKVVYDEASSGFEAINAMEAVDDYDLVTMDYNMPGINGMETFERLKKYGVPIVMVTTESSKKMVIEALKKGLSHFIIKPVMKDDFMKKVTAVLKKHNKPLEER